MKTLMSLCLLLALVPAISSAERVQLDLRQTSMDLVFIDIDRQELEYRATLSIALGDRSDEMLELYGQRYDINFTAQEFGETFITYFWSSPLDTHYREAGCLFGWNTEDHKGTEPDWSCNLTLCLEPRKEFFAVDKSPDAWKNPTSLLKQHLYTRWRGQMNCARRVSDVGMDRRPDKEHSDKHGTLLQSRNYMIALPERD